MNRRAFLKEMIHSLTEAGKEVAAPFIEEDADKIVRAAQTLQGTRWYRAESVGHGYNEQFIGGRPVCIYSEGNRTVACGKVCPHCNQLLQWLDQGQRLICMSCGRDYSFQTQSGSLIPLFYDIRIDKGDLWVALPDQGGISDA